MVNEVGQGSELPNGQSHPPENEDFCLSPDLQGAPRLKAPPVRMKVDENDGVVDVDIHLPSFLSSSPDSGFGLPQPRMARHTPSLTSLDGFASMQSSNSCANRLGQHDCNGQSNVAGYLRKYHQDFSLQALKHYPEVEDEIRVSMRAELTPLHAPVCAPPSGSVGLWVDVCSTLVADVRSFSIRRLSLKRRMPSTTLKAVGTAADAHQTVPSSLTTASLKAVDPIAQSSFEFLPEEVITTETVMDLDATLTDAIERILNRSSTQSSRQPSPTRQAHSRTVSNSTASTIQTQPPATAPASIKDTLPPAADLPRQESRKMVVNALEEVVKSVNEDLNGSTNYENSKLEGSRPAKQEENALREGVKRWLISVEHTDVW
jgi:hypothetical protein